MDEHIDKKLAHVQETIEQFEDSNDYQRGCTAEATKLWQQAHNQPDTLPDIGVLINWLALEIENKQYTITCASEENQQLKEQLAEARAEIERLRQELRDNSTLAARQIVPAEMLVDDLATEIERLKGIIISQIQPEPIVLSNYSTTAEPAKADRDKLIEQMREALKLASLYIPDNATDAIRISEAALSAAERSK